MPHVILAVAALALALHALVAQTPVFRGAVDTVAIYPLVSSDSGRLITDLGAEDFTILDNGQPAQISVFSRDTQPITAVLMLDASASMENGLVRVRESADRLIDALQPTDRLRIGTFGSETVVSPLLTSDKAILRRVLREELWPGGSTPLWTALDAAMQSIVDQGGRRTIVVVTDGVDTTSSTHAPIGERAIKGLFMIYAIGLEGKGLSNRMVTLIGETGGGHFNLRRTDNLGEAFAQIANELRHQYLIGFTPASLDGRPHSLEVRVTRPGMTARAPRQFVSPLRK